MHPTQLNLCYPEHQEGLSLGQKFLHLAIFLHGSQRAGHNKTRPTGWATKAWTGQVTADALLVRGAHPGYGWTGTDATWTGIPAGSRQPQNVGKPDQTPKNTARACKTPTKPPKPVAGLAKTRPNPQKQCWGLENLL